MSDGHSLVGFRLNIFDAPEKEKPLFKTPPCPVRASKTAAYTPREMIFPNLFAVWQEVVAEW